MILKKHQSNFLIKKATIKLPEKDKIFTGHKYHISLKINLLQQLLQVWLIQKSPYI